MNKFKKRSSLHQPHDKIVKRMLSNPETARDILSLYLPKKILAIVDLNHLEIQKDSFIDDEHRAYAADLLYKTTFQDKEGYIWILLEHQRESDYWMPLRLFKYMGMIWEHIRKSSKVKYLPLVYPLVIYNGDTPYAHSLNFLDLIEPEASKVIFRRLFIEPFSLIDLPSIQDDSLRESAQGHIRGIALLMTLKHIFDNQLQSFYEQTLLNILKKIDQSGDTNSVSDLLYYLLNENKFLDKEQFWQTFHNNFSNEVEGKMMTIAQQIEQKGIEKGMEKGMEKGIEKTKLEMAKRLLSEKLGLSETDLIEFIQRMTGLHKDKIE